MIEGGRNPIPIRRLIGLPSPEAQRTFIMEDWSAQKNSLLSSIRHGGPVLNQICPTVEQVREGITPTQMRVLANKPIETLASQIIRGAHDMLDSGMFIEFALYDDIGIGVGLVTTSLDRAEIDLIGEGEREKVEIAAEAAEVYDLDIVIQTEAFLYLVDQGKRYKDLLERDNTGFELADYLARSLKNTHVAPHISRVCQNEGIVLAVQAYKIIHKFLQREYSKRQ